MSVPQEIIALELERLHKAAKADELTLDQARKLVLYLRLQDPTQPESDSRPLADLSDNQLRAALTHANEETK